MGAVVFGLLAVLLLVSAIWVVTLRNLFRAALSLGVVLVSVAGLFILLEAEFIALVQILVYVGAILTLVVFAIMLTARLHTGLPGPVNRPALPAAAASLGLFVLLVSTTRMVTWPASLQGGAVPLAILGQQLVTTLVLPFEFISLVFVAAMVGAIAIARPPGPPLPTARPQRPSGR